MATIERDNRLDTEPDFIQLKRYGHSLQRLQLRYPDVVPDDVIGQALGIPTESVELRYQNIVQTLRENLLVE